MGASLQSTLLVASVGFCGSLTTFSVRTVTRWQEDRPGAAIVFAAGTLLAALAGVGLALGIAGLA